MVTKYLLLLLPLLVVVLPTTVYGGGEDVVYYSSSECFVILHTSGLELSDRQINDACNSLINGDAAFIPDFRDRGLVILFVSIGDTVSFTLG